MILASHDYIWRRHKRAWQFWQPIMCTRTSISRLNHQQRRGISQPQFQKAEETSTITSNLLNNKFWGFIATIPKAQCAENMMPRHTVRARPTGFMENATAMLRCAKASRKASWSGKGKWESKRISEFQRLGLQFGSINTRLEHFFLKLIGSQWIYQCWIQHRPAGCVSHSHPYCKKCSVKPFMRRGSPIESSFLENALANSSTKSVLLVSWCLNATFVGVFFRVRPPKNQCLDRFSMSTNRHAQCTVCLHHWSILKESDHWYAKLANTEGIGHTLF